MVRGIVEEAEEKEDSSSESVSKGYSWNRHEQLAKRKSTLVSYFSFGILKRKLKLKNSNATLILNPLTEKGVRRCSRIWLRQCL